MKTEEPFESELKGFSKEVPFRTPEGYFDRFPLKVTDRIHSEKNRFRFPLPALLKPVPMFATAVVIVTVGILGLKVLNQSDDPLSHEDISTYVYQEGIIDELTEDEILEYSDMAFLEDTSSTVNSASESEDNTLENYLIDQDIDEADIINEL